MEINKTYEELIQFLDTTDKDNVSQEDFSTYFLIAWEVFKNPDTYNISKKHYEVMYDIYQF